MKLFRIIVLISSMFLFILAAYEQFFSNSMSGGLLGFFSLLFGFALILIELLAEFVIYMLKHKNKAKWLMLSWVNNFIIISTIVFILMLLYDSYLKVSALLYGSFLIITFAAVLLLNTMLYRRIKRKSNGDYSKLIILISNALLYIISIAVFGGSFPLAW